MKRKSTEADPSPIDDKLLKMDSQRGRSRQRALDDGGVALNTFVKENPLHKQDAEKKSSLKPTSPERKVLLRSRKWIRT